MNKKNILGVIITLCLLPQLSMAEITYLGDKGIRSILDKPNYNCIACHTGYNSHATVSNEMGSTSAANSILHRIYLQPNQAGFMPIGAGTTPVSTADRNALLAWTTKKLEHAKPYVENGEPITINAYSASLNAQVKENGLETQFRIKYWRQGTSEPANCPSTNSTTAGCSRPASSTGSGGDDKLYGINLNIEDLRCETTYEYRTQSVDNGSYVVQKATDIDTFSTNTCIPLEITSRSNDTAKQFSVYSYDVNTNDTEKPVIFSLDESPQGMTINQDSGFIQWLPTTTGDYSVTVRAKEQNGDGNTIQSFTINVLEGDTNPGTSSEYSLPLLMAGDSLSIRPRLSLNYDKSHKNGLVGVGWSLQGLGKISRCVGTKDIDGEVVPVTNFLQDRFCLDGKRLLSTTNDYRDEGGMEYQVTGDATITKVESYAQDDDAPYEVSTAGRSPAFFKAYTVDGSILEFGKYFEPSFDQYGGIYSAKVPASRFEILEGDIAASWALSRFTDPEGNTYEVSYFEDNYYGEHRPIRVDYKNVSDNINYAIEFEYEDRVDPVKHYLGGSQIFTRKRLSKIKQLVQNELRYEYQLDYDQAPDNLRSRLLQVTKCDDNTTCEDYATINWHSGNIALNYRLNYSSDFAQRQGDSRWQILKTFAFDYNNDGRDDVFRLIKVNGQTRRFWERYSYQAGRWQVTRLDDFYLTPDDTITLADLDGDNVYSMFLKALDQKVTFLADGSVEISSNIGVPTLGLPQSIDNTSKITDMISDDLTHIMDFTGDGVDDMLLCDHGKLITKDGLAHLFAINFTYNLCDKNSAFADINGDGLLDIVQKDGGDVIARWYVRLNTGEIGADLFEQSRIPVSWDNFDNVAINNDLAYDYCPECSWFLKDVNNDGLVDILTSSSNQYSSPVYYSFGHLKQNDRRSDSTYYTNFFSKAKNYDIDLFSPDSRYKPLILDFNNDGYLEVLSIEGQFYSLNATETASESSDLSFGNIEQITGEYLINYQEGIDTVVLDSNGDGADEIFIQWMHLIGEIPGVTENLPEKDTVSLTSGVGFTVDPDQPDNTAPILSISSPQEAQTYQQNTAVELSASAQDNEDGNISDSIVWVSSIDGDLGLGATVSANSLSIGTHLVTASVTDTASARVEQSVTITITTNAAPTLTITSPENSQSFVESSSVALSASANDLEDGDISNAITWQSNIAGNLGSGASISVNTLGVGSHTITAAVLDSANQSSEQSVSIQITENNAPRVSITSVVNSEYESGEAILFSAVANDTEDGALTNIVWSSNIDGVFHTGESITISTLSQGTHQVTATVTDSAAEIAETSINVSILEGTNPGTNDFVLTPTDDRYRWGNSSSVLQADRWNHSFLRFDSSALNNNINQAILRVYYLDAESVNFHVWRGDNDAWTEADGTPEQIGFSWFPSNLLATQTASTAGYVEFDVTSFVQEQHGADQLMTFELSHGPSDVSNSVRLSSKEGLFAPELVIKTNGGGSGTNQLPNVQFTTSTTNGDAPLTVTVDASGSVDPDGSIIDYAWDFNNDGIIDANGITANYTYTEDGSYELGLTVTDNAGDQNTSNTQRITVGTITNDTTTLTPTDDRYRWGTANSDLQVNRWNHSFLRFDSSALNEDISQAILRVYYLDAQSVNLHLWRGDDDAWTEASGIPEQFGYSWLPSNLLATQIASAVGYVDFDVTSFVQEQHGVDQVMTFELSHGPSNTSGTVRLSSKEGPFAPQLVITTP